MGTARMKDKETDEEGKRRMEKNTDGHETKKSRRPVHTF